MSIETIKARVAAATPGPWEASHGYVWWSPTDAPEFPLASVETDDEHYGFSSTPERKVADAEFIVRARTDVELLLAVAEAVEAYFEAVHSEATSVDDLLGSITDAKRKLDAALAALEAAP